MLPIESGFWKGVGTTCDPNINHAIANSYCGDEDPRQLACNGDYRAAADAAGVVCHDSAGTLAEPPDYCIGGAGGVGGEGGYDQDDLGGSPIVLSLDESHGFRFTAAERGVFFDINGDGDLERLGWTEAESSVAFLFLDRNANGYVDDGTELFGDVAPQPPSQDPNGFRALRVFDAATGGGNADGRITRDDDVFSTLRLWTDSNHDGMSQAPELVLLGDSGIVSIGLDYRIINRRDRYGNLFRYVSFVESDSGGRKPCHDVFFVKLADT